jgi:misacylated tRNA(Ala) deacylase
MNYLEIPRKPSSEELKSVQDRCNQCIRDSIPITVKTPEKVSGAKKLPGDYDREKGVVRFIKIGDLDYNACCGTHLKQTSHIGLILLHHTQTVRGTNCRLYFSAGDRATNLATESINAIRNIAVSLSSGSGAEDVKGTVQRLGDSYADAKKREKKLLAEIAQYEGDRIKSVLKSGEVAWCHRPGDGLEFLNSVAFEVKEAVKEHGAVILVSGEVPNAGAVVIVGHDRKVEELAGKAKEAVGTLKGGGKGGRWQGKVSEWKRGDVEALKAATAP